MDDLSKSLTKPSDCVPKMNLMVGEREGWPEG